MNQFLVRPTHSGYVFNPDQGRWNRDILATLDQDESELSSIGRLPLCVRAQWLTRLSIHPQILYFIGFRTRLENQRGSGAVWGFGRVVGQWRSPFSDEIRNELVVLADLLKSECESQRGALWTALTEEGVIEHCGRLEIQDLAASVYKVIDSRIDRLPISQSWLLVKKS